MVTPSCKTAAIAFVIYETSPIKIFEPKLYIISSPIPPIIKSGTIHEFMKIANTRHASNTAISTYIGSSFSQSAFRSVTKAAVPLIRHCLPVTSLIFCTAPIVLSDDTGLSKNTAIIVVSPELNCL